MTANQCGRLCLVSGVVGFVVGLVAQIILLLAALPVPPFLKTACTAVSVAACLGVRYVHERVVRKDYDKLAEERHRRLHW